MIHQFIERPRQPNFLKSLLEGSAKVIPATLGAVQEDKEESDAFKRLESQLNPKSSEESFDPSPADLMILEKKYPGITKRVQEIQKLKENSQILRDIEKRRGLESGSLEAYKENPKLGEQISRPEKEQKTPISLQDIPEDVQKRIENVITKNPDSSADQLLLKMDQKKIPRAYSNAYIENRRRSEENLGKSLSEGYKLNEDFINSTSNGYEASKLADARLAQMEEINDRGNVPPPLMTTLLESMGLPTALWSADAETIEKLTTDLTKDIQQYYGSRILQTEFQAFLKSIPNLKNSQEGRRRIISNLQDFNRIKQKTYQFMREVQKEYEDKNKPLPKDFKQRVLDRLEPEFEALKRDMKDTVRSAEKSMKVERPPKVAPGTPITDDQVRQYLKLYKNDPEAAEKAAREDGYATE